MLEVIEPGGSRDRSTALQQRYSRGTGNNPADLSQRESELVRKGLSVEVPGCNDKLVFFAGRHSLLRGDARNARYPLRVDLYSHIARRRHVSRVGDEPVRDINRGRRAARGECNRRFDARNWRRESRTI